MKVNIQFFLVFIISFSLTSCLKDPKALMVIDDSGDGEVSSLYELPANSSGVFVNRDLVDEYLFEVNIPAEKFYNPTSIKNGWYYFSESAEFELPASIIALAGEAGPHLLVVGLKRKESDSLPANLQCAYVGSSSTATQYDFDFCIEGSILLTEENVDAMRKVAENIFDKNMRSGTYLRVLRSDKISVQVFNSNHSTNESIKVQMKIAAQKI